MLGAGKIGLIFGKREVAGLRTFHGRKVFQDGGIIPNHLSTNVFCNFRCCKWHIFVFGCLLVDLLVAAHYKDRRIQFNPYFLWRGHFVSA